MKCDWTAYKMAAKAVRLGRVWASSEKQALQMAYEEFKVREAERFKIYVRKGLK